MQKQVHEESNLVAKQHIRAVEGTAGTCQVVGVCSSTEGSNIDRWKRSLITSLRRKKKKAHLEAGRYSPCNTLKKHYCWDVNVWPWALTRLSAVIRKPNTLLYICGSLRVQFVFASQKHISLTVRVRKTIWGIKHSYQLLMRRLPFLQPPSEKLERNLSPILAEMVQHFRWRDKTTPLSSSSRPPGSPRQWPVPSQSACLCIMSALKQAREKINASDNWPIVLLWLLLPLASVSSVNIFWQLYILAIGGMACPICSLEERNLLLQCLK